MMSKWTLLVLVFGCKGLAHKKNGNTTQKSGNTTQKKSQWFLAKKI